MTQEELLSVAEVIERLVKRFEEQGAEYERKLAEHRTSFGARTEADAKIIAGLRVEIVVLRAEVAQRQSTLNALQGKIREMAESLGKSLDERDALRAELARLKSQTPKHPAKVGEWVECTLTDACDQRHPLYRIGTKGRVGSIVERPNHIWEYHVTLGGSNQVWWESSYCIPCDPPEADHDTEAGKAVAEAALKTEPVAEEIKVGDLVEVVSNAGRNTWLADVGSVGTVVTVEEINDSISVHLEDVPGQKNALAGYVSFCDVRKVTT